MTTFHLGLTLSVVGPRGKLPTEKLWPMALRLTVGTAQDVAADDIAAFIPDTLPWNIWETPQVDAAVVRDDGSVEVVSCKTEPPLVEDKSFLEALKKSIEANGVRLAKGKVLDTKFGPDMVQVGDTEDRNRTVSWTGLLKTMSTLAPPTPSALLCTWYFWLDPKLIATEVDGKWALVKNIMLSAAPSEFRGARRESVVSRAGPGKYPLHVHGYKDGAAVAYCEALDINAVLDHQLDEMDNFWLAIRDSGDDSLLELGHRIEQALDPIAMLSCLSLDDLVQATNATREQSKGEPTQAEMASAVEIWKSSYSGVPPEGVRKRRDAILRAASTVAEDQAGAARLAYVEQAADTLKALGSAVLVDGIKLDLVSIDDLATRIGDSLLPPPGSGLKPVSPAEGITLLLGDESLRLRHDTAQEHGAVDDVAQIQMFGRRSSDPAALKDAGAGVRAPWCPLTAARYVVQGEDGAKGTFSSTLRVMGVTAAYQDGVLCRELHYVGANMVSTHPLAGVHREQMADDALESFMLARLGREASTADGMRCVALRYGDWYEFAASVVDRAGGMTEQLTTGAPWIFDKSKISALNPPQRNHVRFLRDVPVGDLNLVPASGTSWPQTPPGVNLRCREKGAPDGGGPAPAPLFLVPDDEGFVAPSAGTQPPASYQFLVGVPQVDEHTLLRWLMPATTLSDDRRELEADALQKRLVRIYDKRDELLAEEARTQRPDPSKTPQEWLQVLDDDPAVALIGVRWEHDDGSSGSTQLEYQGKPIAIEVTTGKADTTGSVQASIALERGRFVCIRIYALVASEDLDRFAATTLENHLVADHPWDGYGAFEETVVWAECASDVLPQADAKLLSLTEDALGAVQVTYDLHALPSAAKQAHDNVIQTCVASERWIWRNLPLPPEDGFNADPTETRRRIASGPPVQLMDASLRDVDPAVDTFDRLNAIDTAFVLRADKHPPYPREARASALLLVDERDGHAQAEYLRYAVRFRSRYAAVLAKPETDWSTKRRIAVGFRGNRRQIKPPRVLAVLPLTQALVSAPVPTNSGGGTPFLVVLDELWFREYGIGERLEARVAFVKPEIPETAADAPTQRRFGPLPDHHLKPIEVKGLEEPLTCFGPFGLSLDRGDSQALANATAFVVYPPAGTPPHFNLFVEFARVLDQPTPLVNAASPRSDYSEAYPLYTLADSAALAFGSDDTPAMLSPRANGFDLRGGRQLAPFDGASAEVLSQYRYLMIVGRHVRDGGRGVDVFLPEDALWISSADGKTAQARWIGSKPKRDFTAAVVAEILLNGRFAPDATHPLSDSKSLRDLLLKLLSDADGDGIDTFPEDSPGMLRRVSPWFAITVKT